MGSPPPQRDDPLENEVAQIILRHDHALAEAAKLHEDLARLTAPEPVLSQGDRTGSGRGQVEPHHLPAERRYLVDHSEEDVHRDRRRG